MQDVLSNILDFVSERNIRGVSREWQERVELRNQQIVNTLFARYPTRKGPTWDPIPTETLYDVIRATLDANDVEAIRLITTVYTGFAPVRWGLLYPYVKDARIATLIMDKIFERQDTIPGDFLRIREKANKYSQANILRDVNTYHMGDIFWLANLERLRLLPLTPHINRVLTEYVATAEPSSMIFSYYKEGQSYHLHNHRRYYFLTWLGDNGFIGTNLYLQSLYRDDPELYRRVMLQYREDLAELDYLRQENGRDMVDADPDNPLLDTIIGSQAVKIFKAYVVVRDYAQAIPAVSGPILRAFEQHRDAMRDMLNVIAKFGSENIEDLVDPLDFVINNVNPSEIQYAAQYRLLGLLDKYMDESNYMQISLHAYDYDTIPHVPWSIYLIMLSKGLPWNYIAFYMERENKYDRLELMGQENYETIIEDADDIIIIHGSEEAMEHIKGYDGDEDAIKAAIKHVLYKKWREEHRIEEVPPQSFQEEYLRVAVQDIDSEGSSHIVEQITYIHGSEITADMIIPMMGPLQDIYKKQTLQNMRDAGLPLSVVDDVADALNITVNPPQRRDTFIRTTLIDTFEDDE